MEYPHFEFCGEYSIPRRSTNRLHHCLLRYSHPIPSASSTPGHCPDVLESGHSTSPVDITNIYDLSLDHNPIPFSISDLLISSSPSLTHRKMNRKISIPALESLIKRSNSLINTTHTILMKFSLFSQIKIISTVETSSFTLSI